MKTSINFCQFYDSFENRRENFSYEGLRALYNYLLELEDSCDTEIELDHIALCCEYTEYKDLEELRNYYTDIESMEELEQKTMIIQIEGSEGFIVQDY